MITYVATNTLNGKFYIGSTTNFAKRKRDHLNNRDNLPFQNALRANPDAFEWEVFEDTSDERILEGALLEMFGGKGQCYNILLDPASPPRLYGEDNPSYGLGENHWNKGLKRSPETIDKMRKSLVGNQRTAGKKWWVNEKGERRLTEQQPGPEWKNAMKWNPL